MNGMRKLIDSVDDSKNDENQIPMPRKGRSQFNSSFNDIYSYISSWLRLFDRRKENNQPTNIESIDYNFKILEELWVDIKSSKSYKLKLNIVEQINELVSSIKLEIQNYKNKKLNWEIYRSKIILNLKKIQNIIDANRKDKTTKKPLMHFNEVVYIKPYNYITNWIVYLSKDEKPIPKKLFKQYETLIILFKKVPRYKDFTTRVSKKFFNDEFDSFVKIGNSLNNILYDLRSYYDIAKDAREKENHWIKTYRNMIISELKIIQTELDNLYKQGSLLSRTWKYMSLVPNPDEPMMKS